MTQSHTHPFLTENQATHFSAKLQAFYDALSEEEKPLMQLVLCEPAQPVGMTDVEGFTFERIPGGYGWFPDGGNVGIGGWRAPSGWGGIGGGRVGIVVRFHLF